MDAQIHGKNYDKPHFLRSIRSIANGLVEAMASAVTFYPRIRSAAVIRSGQVKDCLDKDTFGWNGCLCLYG
jgi:hypothetical protein